jgi:hypothetical protein
MNSSFRPIPVDMPLAAAADLMTRRGEAKSYGQACAVLRHRRRHVLGRIANTPAQRAEVKKSFAIEPRKVRLPYADN